MSFRSILQRMEELSKQQVAEGTEQDVMEKMDPDKRARLDDLIDQFRDATDPNDYYDRDYSDPEEVIELIRAEFGDKIASQVADGADKMHFSRQGHTGGYDPMSWKKPVDRQTKAGKMYKQDSDFRKNTIKSRYKLSGKSTTEGVEEGQEKDKLIPGKFYVVTQDHRYAPIKPVAADDWSDDSYEAQIKKAEYDEGGKYEVAVAQWTGKDWNFDFSEGVAEMDNRTPQGDRREQRANSPEEKAKREKEFQDNLKKAGPELRKKLRLPEPKDEGVAEGSSDDLVYISVDRVEAFEDWMNSEGLETNVPKTDEGTYVVYDYSNADHTSKMYASDWNEKKGVAEDQLNELSPELLARYRKAKGTQRDPNWKWNPEKEAERQAHNEPIDKKVSHALNKELEALRKRSGVGPDYRPLKKDEQDVAESEFEPSMRVGPTGDFSVKPNMQRGTPVAGKIGRYGKTASGFADPDADPDAEKAAVPVKRGRGRPRKDADVTGYVPKYDFAKSLQSFMIGNLPGGKLPGKPGKKHRLKDWIEHIESKTLVEGVLQEGNMKEVYQILADISETNDIAEALRLVNSPKNEIEKFAGNVINDYYDMVYGEDSDLSDPSADRAMMQKLKAQFSSELTELALDASQIAVPSVQSAGSQTQTTQAQPTGTAKPAGSAAQPATSATKMGAAIIDFKQQNDPLKAALAQAVKNKEVTVMATEDEMTDADKAREKRLKAKYDATAMKANMIKKYGQEKGEQVYFAKIRKQAMNESTGHQALNEKLSDLLTNYPHEKKLMDEGWGMHESLYQALCDLYWNEGRIPREVMYGPSERLRSRVEECYMEDTQPVMENPLVGLAVRGLAAGAGSAIADRVMDKFDLEEDSVMESQMQKQIDEKWEDAGKVEKTGEYADKSLKTLEKMLAALKKSGPHKEGSKEYKRQNQIEFAIRAKHKGKKKWGKVEENDSQMKDWAAQLNTLLNEGVTITTSTGNQGAPDNVSINASDEDAHELMKLIQASGLGKSSSQAMSLPSQDGTGIKVEPVSQDEVMSTLQPDDDSEEAFGFIKRMLGARGGDDHADHSRGEEEAHGDYEQEDEEQVCADCSHADCECDHEEKVDEDNYELTQHATSDHTMSPLSKAGTNEELEGGQKKLDKAPPFGKLTGADFAALRKEKKVDEEADDQPATMEDMGEWAGTGAADLAGAIAQNGDGDEDAETEKATAMSEEEEVGQVSSTGGSTFHKSGVTTHKAAPGRAEMQQQARDEREARNRKAIEMDEGMERCDECGGAMYEGHECGADEGPGATGEKYGIEAFLTNEDADKLNEWANSPQGKSEDEMLADMVFMTKSISGGLNNMKQDQTVVPSARVKTEKERYDTDISMGALLQKLQNIN